MKRTSLLAVLLGAVLGFAATVHPWAAASRNTGGTYTLPAGNPVHSGTTITSTWANSTLGDIGTELTNSLDRRGYGGMTGQFKLANGSSGAPALTFTAETSSGLYRAGAQDVRLQLNSTTVQQWTAAAVSVTPNVSLGGGLSVADGGTVSGGLTSTGATNGAGVTATGGSGGVGLTASGAAGAIVATCSGSGTTAITATGSGSGAGVSATGGTMSGIGLSASAGTASNAASPTNAAELTNGNLLLSGASPNSNVGFANTLTPKNVVKAWASVIYTGSGTFSVGNGFNIASVALATNATIRVTLATSLGSGVSANNAILVTTGPSTAPWVPKAQVTTAAAIDVSGTSVDGITVGDPVDFHIGQWPFYVLVMGAQ